MENHNIHEDCTVSASLPLEFSLEFSSFLQAEEFAAGKLHEIEEARKRERE